MTGATGVREKTPMKNDYKKDLNRTPLTTKDVRVLSQSHSFCETETLKLYPLKNRRFVSGIVYLLFSASFIYLVAGPWIGWDGSLAQQTLINVCGTAALVRWPLRKYILKCAWIRRAQKWQIIILCLIPWRALSRSWGMIAGLYVPKVARPLVYGVYCKLFGVDTDEMEKPLNGYISIKDFFTRRLRMDARSIDTVGLLISPCDGTIVQCGPISDKYIKRVKGLDYCLETFLGVQPNQTQSSPLYKTCLYQCVIYLAPGDYHRFHSPCDWSAFQRQHFCGQLLSVAPKMVRWLPNLLELNERAVYIGQWEHGFFSYTAVGATNVGSIIIHDDPTLATNKFRPCRHAAHVEFSPKNELIRGQEMGLFSMGSTIVLIFEAPENFHFTCRENEKIKVGSCLGGLDFMCSSSHISLSSLDSEDTSDVDWNEYDYEFGGSEKLLVS